MEIGTKEKAIEKNFFYFPFVSLVSSLSFCSLAVADQQGGAIKLLLLLRSASALSFFLLFVIKAAAQQQWVPLL